MTKEKLERVRVLNDQLRRSFAGGRVFMTAGIAAMTDEDRTEVLLQVRTFEDFNLGNDPYQEHDFGAFDFKGDRINWKIDYFQDEKLEYGADDATKCFRVLTVMFAEER